MGIPLPKGHEMAETWGLLTTYINWDDTPSTGKNLTYRKHLNVEMCGFNCVEIWGVKNPSKMALRSGTPAFFRVQPGILRAAYEFFPCGSLGVSQFGACQGPYLKPEMSIFQNMVFGVFNFGCGATEWISTDVSWDRHPPNTLPRADVFSCQFLV